MNILKRLRNVAGEWNSKGSVAKILLLLIFFNGDHISNDENNTKKGDWDGQF